MLDLARGRRLRLAIQGGQRRERGAARRDRGLGRVRPLGRRARRLGQALRVRPAPGHPRRRLALQRRLLDQRRPVRPSLQRLQGHSRHPAEREHQRFHQGRQTRPRALPDQVRQGLPRPTPWRFHDLRLIQLGRRRRRAAILLRPGRPRDLPGHPRLRPHPRLHARHRHHLGRSHQAPSRPPRRRSRPGQRHLRLLRARRRHGLCPLLRPQVHPRRRPSPPLLGSWPRHQRLLRSDPSSPRNSRASRQQPPPRWRRRPGRVHHRRSRRLGHHHDLCKRRRLLRRGAGRQNAHDCRLLVHGSVLPHRDLPGHHAWLQWCHFDSHQPRLPKLERTSHPPGIRPHLLAATLPPSRGLGGFVVGARHEDILEARPSSRVRKHDRRKASRRCLHCLGHRGCSRSRRRHRHSAGRIELRRQLHLCPSLVGRHLLAHQAQVPEFQFLRHTYGTIRLCVQASLARYYRRARGRRQVLADAASHERQESHQTRPSELVQHLHLVEHAVWKLVVRERQFAERRRCRDQMRRLGLVSTDGRRLQFEMLERRRSDRTWRRLRPSRLGEIPQRERILPSSAQGDDLQRW
mmetsp:Transcript_14823/g.46628  ORF Transcript_14823/g.46628 Transcript_14823/m.46628 type:complete len:576 (-) Transcript_14823:1586-3313(-)